VAKDGTNYKFGVASLAKDLGLQAASVRVALRKHKVKKNEDGVYGWNDRKAYDAVKAKLKSDAPAAAKKKPAKKPAKKKAA